MTLVTRVACTPAAPETCDPVRLAAPLRRIVTELDSALPIRTLRTMAEVRSASLARQRFLATLLAAFAAFAVLLALIGVYSVIAYAVRQREHEIAVRMAVGAAAGDVTRLFVRQGLVVLAAGLAIGLYGAAVIGRVVDTQTLGVTASRWSAPTIAAITFAGAGLAAIWWPARRAARTDPAVALRQE
jgi:putative ABC transport system permease protein